jgi:hypothetical protein
MWRLLSLAPGAAIAVTLAACSWLLPRPAHLPWDGQTTDQALSCSLQLVEARRALSTSMPGAGAAEPIVITLAAGESVTRIVHGGDAVTFRRLTDAGEAHEVNRATEVSLIAALPDTSTEIADQDVVQLQHPPASPADGHAARGAAPPSRGALVILKADTPNPNRPSTCDAQLRDGDLVFLRSATRKQWMTVADGVLAAQPPPRGSGAQCRRAQRRCYTDRYGGVVCAGYFACSSE